MFVLVAPLLHCRGAGADGPRHVMIPITYLNNYACPTCEHVLERSVLSTRDRLGPAYIECPNCGQSIDTGKMEWEEMGPPRRRWFWCKRIFWGMVASALISGVVCLLLSELTRWGLRELGIIPKGRVVLLAPAFLLWGFPPQFLFWTSFMVWRTLVDIEKSRVRTAPRGPG